MADKPKESRSENTSKPRQMRVLWTYLTGIILYWRQLGIAQVKIRRCGGLSCRRLGSGRLGCWRGIGGGTATAVAATSVGGRSARFLSRRSRSFRFFRCNGCRFRGGRFLRGFCGKFRNNGTLCHRLRGGLRAYRVYRSRKPATVQNFAGKQQHREQQKHKKQRQRFSFIHNRVLSEEKPRRHFTAGAAFIKNQAGGSSFIPNSGDTGGSS